MRMRACVSVKGESESRLGLCVDAATPDWLSVGFCKGGKVERKKVWMSGHNAVVGKERKGRHSLHAPGGRSTSDSAPWSLVGRWRSFSFGPLKPDPLLSAL